MLELGAPSHSQTEEKLLINAGNDRRDGQREDDGSEEEVDGLKKAAQPHGRPGQQEDDKAQEPLWTRRKYLTALCWVQSGSGPSRPAGASYPTVAPCPSFPAHASHQVPPPASALWSLS